MDINSSLTIINSQLQDTLKVCEAEDKLKPIIAKHHSQVEEPKPVEQKEEDETISLRPRFSAPQTSHAAHLIKAEPDPDPKKTFSPLCIMQKTKLREQGVAGKSEVSSPDKEALFEEMLALGDTKKLDDVEQIQEGWKTIIYDPPSTGPVTEHVDRDFDALPFVQRSKVDELYELAVSGDDSHDGCGSGAQSKLPQPQNYYGSSYRAALADSHQILHSSWLLPNLGYFSCHSQQDVEKTMTNNFHLYRQNHHVPQAKTQVSKTSQLLPSNKYTVPEDECKISPEKSGRESAKAVALFNWDKKSKEESLATP